jgi:hypothetical protein
MFGYVLLLGLLRGNLMCMMQSELKIMLCYAFSFVLKSELFLFKILQVEDFLKLILSHLKPIGV